MTVWADRFMVAVPAKWQGGGHLLTSDLEELHQFAARLGLRRAWFQDRTFPHYDLTAGKRAAALRAGAVELAAFEFPDDLLVRCECGSGHIRYARRRARMNGGDEA